MSGHCPDGRLWCPSTTARRSAVRSTSTPTGCSPRRFREAGGGCCTTGRRVRHAARLLRPGRERRDAPVAHGPAEGGLLMTTAPSTQDPAIEAVRREVSSLHAELVRYNLVAWTAGNVSGRVPGADLFIIKPSGVDYDEIAPDNMILCKLDGSVVEGDLSPSSDTAAHAC